MLEKICVEKDQSAIQATKRSTGRGEPKDHHMAVPNSTMEGTDRGFKIQSKYHLNSKVSVPLKN